MTAAKKPGTLGDLRARLNDMDIEVKQSAIRGIIDQMTNGKDVSSLFMDVIKNMETPSLQLKKLIYLYVMSYAKVHPDLAILGVNTFRKDAVDRSNPFLRGLAVRTMGCIRIKEITEYLCDPLKRALKDQDPYVRKTGALCVPKLLEISPELIEAQGFLKLLQNLLNDGNATVVSNAIASLAICSEIKGEPLLHLSETLVQKLLTAMNDCNEWGVVYILDTLSNYIPKDPQQAENIMERVSSRLNHTNSAVALSSIRLIIKYMDYLSNGEVIRSYNNKISAPLITMISRENEISYLVLKTINLVLQKRPLLLPKQLKIFFVNYHDPLYVKLQKLQVLSKIANNENILMILHELKEYIHEVDVQFVRKTVNTMGKCAIKLQKMADKCVQCLMEALKTKINYVVQQVVIVIRDVFRKYPHKYQGVMADICSNLNTLDDPQAKAAIVWIIGEHIDIIDNADELMLNFTQNFKDEPDVVQQQILISCMKLYLTRPEDGQQILKDLFNYITKESENPDLRDRGFIYWRMLSTNPQLAKKVVMSQRPLISDQSYTLQTEFLDKLIENIGTLSSVYCKQPEDFVKRLKDNANAKEMVEEDAETLLPQKQQQEKVEFFDNQNANVSYANKGESLVSNTPTNLLDVTSQTVVTQKKEESPKKNTNQSQGDLLDMSGPVQPPSVIIPQSVSPPESLLENDPVFNPTKAYQTSVNQGQTSFSPTNFSTTAQVPSSSPFNFFEPPVPAFKNIVIPFIEVMSETQSSQGGKYNGLSIRGAFQREGEKMFLHLVFNNCSNTHLSQFAIKLNSNCFKFGYPKISIDDLDLPPGSSRQAKLQLSAQNNYSQLQEFPYSIDCALKVLDDVFIFRVPCCLSVPMLPNLSMTPEQYKQIIASEQTKKQESIPNKLALDAFISRLKDNNLIEVVRSANGDMELMVFGCVLVNGIKFIMEVMFDRNSNAVNARITAPSAAWIMYFVHAMSMIVNL